MDELFSERKGHGHGTSLFLLPPLLLSLFVKLRCLYEYACDSKCMLIMLTVNTLSVWLFQVMVVSLVNQWLTPFFEDSAEYGLNAYSEEIQFYQDMGFNCPFLLGEFMFAHACICTLLYSSNCSVYVSRYAAWCVVRRSGKVSG